MSENTIPLLEQFEAMISRINQLEQRITELEGPKFVCPHCGNNFKLAEKTPDELTPLGEKLLKILCKHCEN